MRRGRAGLRRRLAPVAAVGALALLAGCTSAPPKADVPPRALDSRTAGAAAVELARGLSDLPKGSAQGGVVRHLAAGLVPPTNRWFSGMVFGAKPQPVFPMPLSFTPSAEGFAIGLPHVSATENTIFGPAAKDFGLRFAGSGFRVTRYDALSVTSTWGDADVTLAEGWPYVAVHARRALTATLSGRVHPTSTPGLAETTVGGTRYAILTPAGAVKGGRLSLDGGARAVLFALPNGVGASTLIAGARAAVTGGSVRSVVHDTTVTTELRYATVGGGRTVLAAMPHQQAGGAGCHAGTVPSAYGTMHLCTGTALKFGTPRRKASSKLDLSGISAADRDRIRTTLAADIRSTPASPADSYGGGKWLYRLANLLQLARGLGATEEAATARQKLDASLGEWTDATRCRGGGVHCFVYDPSIKGVVGHDPSYGSDQFNDHHFHYGYFLYAAAVAVADRPALKSRFEPVVNLLAADIASPTATADLPEHRVFDAYAGHSWASGYSPFADGNNQESSSEAVNAWNGLSLWASATGNTALGDEATWLLSNEVATAKAYWVTPDLSDFPGFPHHFVSLNWGGKRDSATWFSPDPAAKLAIQLIPMSPASTYLKSSASSINANLTEAGHSGLFADYLLMYRALSGAPTARLLKQAEHLPASRIDGANSRAYLEAWVATK